MKKSASTLLTLSLLAGTSLATASLATAASSVGAEFCESSDDNCAKIQIKNTASATVTKVNVTQQTTDGACEKKEETISRNLTGGIGGSGESVYARFVTSCTYKIKYVTTSGCSGDKEAYFKAGNFPGKYNFVKLKGDCGHLETTKDRDDDINETPTPY